jgi:hypothetical protein
MSITMSRPSAFDMHDPAEALIRLCDKVRVLGLERDALLIRGAPMTPGAQFERVWSRAKAKTDEAQRLAGAIAKMPAHTFDGVKARASALQAIMPVDYSIGDSIPIDWHRGLLDALLQDIAGRV